MPTASHQTDPGREPRTSEPDAPRPGEAEPQLHALLALQKTAGNAAVARLLAERRPAPVELTPAAEQGVQRGLWDRITGAVSSAASAVGGAVTSAASAVGGAVSSAASWVGDKAGSAASWVGNAASSAWDAIGGAAQAAWEGISSAASFVGRWGMEVLSSAGEWVWDLVTEAPGRVWRLLEHVGSGIVGTLGFMWDGLKGAAGHVWNGLVGALGWLGEGASGLFNWVWDGMKRGASWARRVLSGDWAALREGLAGALDWLGDGFKGLISWGWEGLEAAGIWIAEGAAGVGRWLLDGFLAGAAWTGRLIAKLADLVGMGEIADLIGQLFKLGTRELTPGEVSIAHGVFLDTIDYGQVRVDENSLIARIGAHFSGGHGTGMGVTLFHTINFNRKVTASAASEDAGWLVHEMTHVWQYEHVGGQYIGEAIHAQATVGYKYGTSTRWEDDGNGTFLADQRRAGATFASFNREQQGDITSHYYMRKSNGKDVTDWQPYIDDVRAGIA
jgi:hypothetical protein